VESHLLSAHGRSGPVTEPQWSTEKTKRAMGKLLVLYEKTELFWAALALADLVAQGTRSDSSSQGALNVLSEWP
jgi:hypothetical protein